MALAAVVNLKEKVTGMFWEHRTYLFHILRQGSAVIGRARSTLGRKGLLWPGLQGGYLGKSPTTLLIPTDTLSTGMSQQGEEVMTPQPVTQL